MTKIEDKNSIIEKALQSNFQNRPAPEIPKQWRVELRGKIDELELEEEVLFIKYENRIWDLAWISFAASVFIFISLMYFFNKENPSLKQAITKEIYEYLTMENEL